MRHLRARRYGLYALLLVVILVWIVCLLLLWLLTTLYLDVINAVVELAQLG